MRAVVRTTADLQRFVDRVAEKLDGKPYTVTIKRFHRPRTQPQNRLLHTLFREMAFEVGYTENEIKEYFKSEFGPKKTIRIGGGERVVPKGTSEYTVMEMMDLIEHVHRVAGEMGIILQLDIDAGG
jgi:hypothetical protein